MIAEEIKPGMAFQYAHKKWIDFVIGIYPLPNAPGWVKIYVIRLYGKNPTEIFEFCNQITSVIYNQFDWERL